MSPLTAPEIPGFILINGHEPLTLFSLLRSSNSRYLATTHQGRDQHGDAGVWKPGSGSTRDDMAEMRTFKKAKAKLDRAWAFKWGAPGGLELGERRRETLRHEFRFVGNQEDEFPADYMLSSTLANLLEHHMDRFYLVLGLEITKVSVCERSSVRAKQRASEAACVRSSVQASEAACVRAKQRACERSSVRASEAACERAKQRASERSSVRAKQRASEAACERISVRARQRASESACERKR